jgi:putative ABC transport system permease protein
MDFLLRNIRYAIRALARAPGFSSTVVLTLALSIGATSAVFSLVDALLLRPLSFPEGDRLVSVMQMREGVRNEIPLSPARLEEWNSLSSSFDMLTGYMTEDVADTTGDLPENVRRAGVAPRFLEVWRVSPALGRGFELAEHTSGGVALVSDRYWRTRMGADPDVLKRSIRIADRSLSVVGVMPKSFMFPDRDVDIWLPVAVDPRIPPRQSTWYFGVGRLKAGVSLEQARADVARIQSQLATTYPETDRGISPSIVSLREATLGDVGRSLWLMFGAVLVLLLIACTNVAALMLSRAAQRDQEVAICFSLGASRVAVAAQMLTETAVLAIVSAALGVLIAAGIAGTFRLLAPDLPRLDEIAINWRVALFAFVAAGCVTLLCGLAPAIQNTRISKALQSAGRTQVSSRHSLQWTLVGVQVALSVALLSGAGLLVRSLSELGKVDSGFDADRVLTFRISATYAELQKFDGVIQRVNTTIDELARLPGVEATATSSILPGAPGFGGEFHLVGSQTEGSAGMLAVARAVSPSYFQTLGIPLVSGELCRRPVSSAEISPSMETMVNQQFVDRHLAGRSPIGLHIAANNSGPSNRIVGVVGNAREAGTDKEVPPHVYACLSAPTPMPIYLVRARGNPMALVGALRLKLKELEPLRSVHDIAVLEERIEDTFSQNRLRTTLLVVFAAAALVLTCLGVYGTLSYTTALRRREIGLLLALGSLRGAIVGRFVRESLVVVGIACLAGLGLLFALTPVLRGMLFGVAAADPPTLAGVIVLVLIVGIVAALLPALRAARVDPMQTLRQE